MQELRVLLGKQRILDHLGIDKNIFYDLIRRGAPIVKDGSQWISHIDLLDDWFKTIILESKVKR